MKDIVGQEQTNSKHKIGQEQIGSVEQERKERIGRIEWEMISEASESGLDNIYPIIGRGNISIFDGMIYRLLTTSNTQ